MIRTEGALSERNAANSISAFVSTLNEQDGAKLNTIVAPHLRGPVPDGKWVAKLARGGQRYYFSKFGGVTGHDQFAVDGDYGIILFYQPDIQPEIILFSTGFTINAFNTQVATEVKNTISGDTINIVKDQDPREFPRIVQIQALTRKHRDNGIHHRRIVSVLNQLEFNKVGVDMIIGLARFTESPAVGLLPGDLNPNRSHLAATLTGQNAEKRALEILQKRYDQTALHYKMTRTSSDGLYMMSLSDN